MTTNIHKKECVVKNNFNLIVTTPKLMTEINILMQNLYPNKCSKANMSHKYPPKTYIYWKKIRIVKPVQRVQKKILAILQSFLNIHTKYKLE